MAGRRFPTDEAFAELRAEANALKAAFGEMRGALSGAASAAAGAGRAAGAANAGAADNLAKQATQLVRIVDLTKTLSDLQKGFRAGSTIARAFGFDEATRHLTRMTVVLEQVSSLTTGVAAGVRLLRAAWAPMAGAVAIVAAGLVGVREIIERTTGVSLSLSDTVRAMGLRFAIAFADARRAYHLLASAISGTTPEIVRSMNEATLEGARLQEELDKIAERAAQAGQRPPESWAQWVARLRNEFETLGTEFAGFIGPILDRFETALMEGRTQERQRSPVTTDPTDFDRFRLQLEQMGNAAANTYEFIASGVQQLSGTIATAIIDGFLDPQADIRDSFMNLFKMIGQQIIQMTLQLVIAKALLAAISVGTGGAAGFGGIATAVAGAVFGGAEGGPVPGRARASFAHLFARGLFGGGRPAGLDPRDTVPAWLAPGEFIQPTASVNFYGGQVMEALRRRTIDPGLMRALSGGISVPSAVPAPSVRGYAAGGSVAALGGGGGISGPMPAVIAASDQAVENLMTGGKNAMLRFLDANGYRRG